MGNWLAGGTRGNWEPYPIDMAFEAPCCVLSHVGLAQAGAAGYVASLVGGLLGAGGDGSEDDEGVSDDERPGPFADFPSRKEARKLSEGQRETLVRSPPPVRSLPGSVAKKVS